MNANNTPNKNLNRVAFADSMCSDGMCCFTCVIPSNNRHIGFIRSFWKSGSGFSHVKLLVTSDGRKNELYDSCRFLDFVITQNEEGSSMKMDLRCSIYRNRPTQCKGYPDKAGESLDYEMSGPCIFNEYTAPSFYKKLVYKRDWEAFFAIRDDRKALRRMFVHRDTDSAREKVLRVEDVKIASISVGKKELDYILIPLPKYKQNVLYLSEKHPEIYSIRQAYQCWGDKIEKNLQHHYGDKWKTMLNDFLEMEEADVSKRYDEDTTRNLEC